MRELTAQELNYVSAGSDADDIIGEIFFEIFYEIFIEVMVQFFVELTVAGFRKIHDCFYPPEVVVFHQRFA